MVMRKVLRAIIMGPPGSGKGTIATRIVKDFKINHLSSGDLLRSQIKLATPEGMSAVTHIEKGALVPDDLMVKLVLNELNSPSLIRSSWLLDGFPRTLMQAKTIINNTNIDVVLNLDVPFEEITTRIKGRYIHERSGRIYHSDFNPPKIPGRDNVTGEPLMQREDDKEDVVRARLATYEANTKPVLEYFREMSLLKEFQGRQTNDIWPSVHKELSRHITPLRYTEYLDK